MKKLRAPSNLAAASVAVGAALAAFACGGAASGPVRPEPVAETCKTQLSQRSGPLDRPAAPPAAPATTPPSRLVVHADLRLAALQKELETKVGRRLAEEKGQDIGVAGSLDYTADRGPFSVAIEGEALVVKTDITAHAQACAKGRCYASCDPVAVAKASIPLALLPDYRFAPSRVTVQFTKPCTIKVLGGFMRVDVTPTIQAQLGPSIKRVEREIDGKLPPIKPQAERLWSELSRTRPLPLGGCVVVDPRGLVQGPVSGAPDGVRLRFGLLAAPEIRTRCPEGTASAPRPLPPLVQDRALPPEEELTLGLVTSLANVGTSIEGADPLDAGPGRARIAKATPSAAGRGLDVDLGLRGEVCGDLGVRAGVAWAKDRKTLTLDGAQILPAEALRASGLDPKVLAASLASNVHVAPPLPIENLATVIPDLAASMSDATLDVSATAAPAIPADAAVRGDDLVAWVKLRGAVTLKQK